MNDIACTPWSVPAADRPRWIAAGRATFAAVAEIRELPAGYACRLPHDARTLVTLAEYVSLDRLCCAFLRWSIDIEPAGGAIWLHMTGPEGTKAVLKEALLGQGLLRGEVAATAFPSG